MRYELLLQAEPGQTYDDETVERALAARGVRPTGEGRVWKLTAGEVEVKKHLELGKVLGTELHVPLTEREELIKEAVVEGVKLALECRVRLLDLQLMQPLTAADHLRVSDQYKKTARYAGQMLGENSALNAAFEESQAQATAPPQKGTPLGGKGIVLLVGFLFVLYLIADEVLSKLRG